MWEYMWSLWESVGSVVLLCHFFLSSVLLLAHLHVLRPVKKEEGHGGGKANAGLPGGATGEEGSLHTAAPSVKHQLEAPQTEEEVLEGEDAPYDFPLDSECSCPSDIILYMLVRNTKLRTKGRVSFNLKDTAARSDAPLVASCREWRSGVASYDKEFWTSCGIPVGYGNLKHIENGRRLVPIAFYGCKDPRLDFEEDRMSKFKR